MYKAASKKISIFLTGFILLAWAAFGPASPCSAGMHELSDGEMAAVYATGFSTFSLTGDTARVDFNNVILSTWTEIDSMKMGYYNNGTTTAWDNDWTNVSLGTSSTDLVAQGLFIEAKFSNMTDPATRTAGIRPHRDDQSDRAGQRQLQQFQRHAGQRRHHLHSGYHIRDVDDYRRRRDRFLSGTESKQRLFVPLGQCNQSTIK